MMQRRIAVLLVAILLVYLKAGAQSSTYTIDSLRHLISTKADSNKVNLLLALGDAYEENNNIIKAKNYYRQAGRLSQELHYSKGIYKYLFDYLIALSQQSKYDSMLYYSGQVEKLATLEKDSTQLVHAWYVDGMSYRGLEQYDSAIARVLQALVYYERNKRNDMTAVCYNELLNSCLSSGQYSQAIQYGEKAVKMYRKYRPARSLVVPLQNLAVAYKTIKQYRKAIPILNEALGITKKYNNEYAELVVLTNLEYAYLGNGIADEKTKVNIDRIAILADEFRDDESRYNGLALYGDYYLLHNRLALANSNATHALKIAVRLKNNELTEQCYLLLTKIAYARHDYAEAISYNRQLNLVQQKITTESVNHSMIELQTKYETAKKEARIKQLQTQQALQKISIQQKRMYLIIALGIIVLLVISGLFYYRNHRRRQKLFLTQQQLQQQKITTLEKEKQLMATQAVLQGQEEERSRLAKDLHDGLGGILSGAKYSLNNMKENLVISSENAAAFERTMAMLDQSISELRRVAHNMMPERLINQSLGEALKDFCHQVSANSTVKIEYHDFGTETVQLDNTIKVTVYRVVQELINNIMKHAQASNAIVQLIVKDKMLNLTVEDDGRGFDTNQLKNVEGIGYKNIQNRIAFLKGNIDIRSQADEGTSVYLQIPV